MRLQELGYEIDRGKHGQPEIKGYTQEYLDASSPRRVQIQEHLQEIGREGAGAAQVAAHRTRDSKEIHSPEEVLQRHRELAARFGHQADRVVALAHEQHHVVQPEKSVIDFDRGGLKSSHQGNTELSFKPQRRKPPQRVTVAPEDKLLVSREEAAQLLSISQRGLDYLVASKRLPTRRIGGRVLIPVADLRKYARCDHPERIVS